MQYVRTGQRLISVGLVNFGVPFERLHEQTDAGVYELFYVEGHSGFRNLFSIISQNRFDERGYWAEITADMVAQDSAGETNGMLPVTYISHKGAEMERTYRIVAPGSGFYVPTDECETVNGVLVPFQPGTGIPFKTVPDKEEAKKILEKYGLNPEYASFFIRPNNYTDGDRFVGRGFLQEWHGGGHFSVCADWIPSHSGYDRAASRPKYNGEPNPEIVMEV